ncbi:MAG: glycosyltransferase, partial [Akkermansiaceae bacterium]
MSNDVSSWIWFGLYTAVLLALAGYGCHRLTIIYLYFKHGRKRPTPAREFKTMPLVTIQLPVFNEMHVVDRLLDSVAALDYPQEKMEIQILDDSTDETVEISRAGAARLRDKGFNAECIHRTDRTGFKAGA